MDQRKTRRFALELPLSITRSGSERVAHAGRTKNISSGGVLFTSGTEPDLGGPIEYVIALNQTGAHVVNLRCIGKVVRAERVPANASDAFEIAATLERYEFLRGR